MYLLEDEIAISKISIKEINDYAKEILNIVSEIPNYENDKNCQNALINACEFYALTILKKTKRNN